MRIIQFADQELVARLPHAAQVDLCFGNSVRERMDLRIGFCPNDFAREHFHPHA